MAEWRWEWLQVLEACQASLQLQGAQQAQRRHPAWLAKAERPVLLGGSGAVVCAYCIIMYTIYHVARAYKKLELKVCPPVSNDEVSHFCRAQRTCGPVCNPISSGAMPRLHMSSSYECLYLADS